MVRFRCGVGLLVIVAALALLLGGQATAREAVVTLHDGRTLTGELANEDPQKVVLEIAGIPTPIERKDIARVEMRQSVEEEYRGRRAGLADEDVPGRLELTQWLIDRRAFNLAQREIRDLQQIDPENERVRALSNTVDAALDLERQASSPPPNRPRPPQAGGRATQTQRAEAPQLLDDKQITLIKVWELPANLSSTSARIEVPRPVIEEIFGKFREDPAVPRGRGEQREFFSRSGSEQLGWIFDLATRNVAVRDYYDDVVVRGDPEAIAEFRRGVYSVYIQRYFRRTFADEGKIPGFVLFANLPNANAELYTNFYILTQTTYQDQPLINRASPRSSLLLQWGLPREAASFPAPDVPGWRPFFTGLQDPNFDRFAQWIDTLYKSVGDYGINYAPPGGQLQLTAPPATESANQSPGTRQPGPQQSQQTSQPRSSRPGP